MSTDRQQSVLSESFLWCAANTRGTSGWANCFLPDGPSGSRLRETSLCPRAKRSAAQQLLRWRLGVIYFRERMIL
jgi:hypothetical protein